MYNSSDAVAKKITKYILLMNDTIYIGTVTKFFHIYILLSK